MWFYRQRSSLHFLKCREEITVISGKRPVTTSSKISGKMTWWLTENQHDTPIKWEHHLKWLKRGSTEEPLYSRSSSKCVSMPSAPGTEQMSLAFRKVLHLFTRQQCPPSSFCLRHKRVSPSLTHLLPSSCTSTQVQPPTQTVHVWKKKHGGMWGPGWETPSPSNDILPSVTHKERAYPVQRSWNHDVDTAGLKKQQSWHPQGTGIDQI